MAENAIISDLEFAPQLSDDMVLAVEDTQNTYSATLGDLRGQLNKIFVEKKDVDFDTLVDDGFYQVSGTLNHQPEAGQITWLVQVVKDGTVIVQNAFGTDATNFLKLFVRRYNGTSWSSWTNISASGIDLSTKANTDLSNISSNIDYVVESKINTNGSWYRKYKSGWLEQGGNLPEWVGADTKTGTFSKPFKDTKYYINAKVVTNGAGGQYYYMNTLDIRPKSTSQFTYYCPIGESKSARYFACGQGA